MTASKRTRRSWLLAGLAIVVTIVMAIAFRSAESSQELLARGLAQLDNGNRADALLTSEKLRSRDDSASQRFADLLEGIAAVQVAKYDEAIAVLEQAREFPGTQARAWLATGEALYHSNQQAEAAKSLRVAVDYDGDQVEAHRMLASIYYDIGAMQAAIEQLAEVARLDPADARPHRVTGLIYKDYERFDDAVAAYNQALEKCKPGRLSDEVKLELAECHIQLNQFPEADSLLAKLTGQPRVAGLRGQCAFASGNLQRAQKLVDQALTVDSDSATALRVKADLLVNSGDHGAALAVLKSLVELEPVDPELRYRLAQALRQTGATVEADEQLKRMKELSELRSRFTELHQRALYDDKDAELRFELGQLALKLQRVSLAATWFQAALTIDPQHAQARESLQKLREANTL